MTRRAALLAFIFVAALCGARAQESGNWLTYSGGMMGQRYSPLTDVTPVNVKNLELKWIYQVQSLEKFEATPIVVDGVMYTVQAPNDVIALDAATGRAFWTYSYSPSPQARLCCGRVNRGVAIFGGTIFMGTIDGHLIALDAKSGGLVWNIAVGAARAETGYGFTMAPLVIKDKVLVGSVGGEFGVRGFLAAIDAKTGKEAWRFSTVPGPGEKGHDTWAGDSWKNGGGPLWVTGSYDPDLNLTYWGIGNPGPDWNGDKRAGDNLYTESVVALDADTGALKWHFQFTPHDVHDWDATEIPVLAEATVKGRTRQVVAMANRNAFFYLLDRDTGEFLHASPYAKQTWAKGIDDRGRPVVLPNTEPTVEGTLLYPSLQGGTNWFSPSYSPVSALFYVAVREMSSYYFRGEAKYRPGALFVGGGEHALDGDQAYGAIRALEISTGNLRWEFRLHSPPWAGVLSTAGGLVFGGSNEGNFYALDAITGKPLWDYQTGGPVVANPIAFAVDGNQYVVIAAGHALFVFGLDRPLNTAHLDLRGNAKAH
jgi:alcohol dehydrogenase (cytochrome c)